MLRFQVNLDLVRVSGWVTVFFGFSASIFFRTSFVKAMTHGPDEQLELTYGTNIAEPGFLALAMIVLAFI